MKEVFNKLNEIIKDYNNFIIMGHKDPDLDSLGSSLGIYEIIRNYNKDAYLFLNIKNLNKYNSNVKQSLEKIGGKISYLTSKTYKKLTGKTLVIITDVHQKERLEHPKILDEYDYVVLDHHIKSKNYIRDAKFMYLDSNLSSMSELITYFAEFHNICFDSIIATILLAGIEIDTNGFNLKTTNMTYEAASLLMEMGADSISKQELLKETKEEYMKRASSIKNSFMLNSDIAMCVISGNSTSVELAEIADNLLMFDGVKASIALGKTDESTICISSRSSGEIDILSIMKSLGGGGSTTNAAAQIKNKSLKEIKQQIKDIIDINNNL